MHQVSVSTCIGFGWATFKKRPSIFVAALLIATAIATIFHLAIPRPDQAAPAAGLLMVVRSLIFAAIDVLFSMGLVTFLLRAHDDAQSAKISDLWNPEPFWRYLAGEILASIIIFFGFVLLVVPGLIAVVGLGFFPYLIIDRGMGPIDALKESWHITRGNKWQLFLLALVTVGLNFVGIVLFVVGLLVTMPVTMLAVTHAYRTLADKAV